MMNKTTFGAALAFLFVAAGALTAGALYLRRREKELDEYERLLFSEDLDELDDDFEEDEEPVYEPIPTESAEGESAE